MGLDNSSGRGESARGRMLVFAALAGSAIVLVFAAADWPTMRYRQDDFIAYWTASRALLDGVDEGARARS